jgi:electron transport complex protein RnfG
VLDKAKYYLQESWLVIASSLFFGVLLAVTNAALGPRIEQNRLNKLNARAKAMLAGAEQFRQVDAEIEVVSGGGRREQVAVYRAESKEGECVGWTFTASGPGYQDEIELVVVVDKDFEKLRGYDVLSSNETTGFGDQIKYSYFRDQFVGAPAGELQAVRGGVAEKIDSEIVVISGSTISSEAVVGIISRSVTQVKRQLEEAGLIGGQK